jgi:fibronectin-binding autotransporter adhesin
MKLKSTSHLALPLASAIVSLLVASSVHAGQIWDGTGADDNWNTSNNWDFDVLPTFTNVITFTGNTRNGAINNLIADSIIGGINLANDGIAGNTNAFTLSGNRITLGGNIVTTASSSVITDTISLAMILNGNRTITTNANHNLTISGAITETGGARSLTKDGLGTLTLSGINTYTGGTTISGGTLNVANVSGLGGTNSNVLLNAGSTTLRLSTDTAFGGGNPVYNIRMTAGGSYTSTIELNRATAGASTGITHNFGLLTISLNGGGAATLNVTAGANAGALDTIAFTGLSAGNNNLVTETLNPTGANISIGTLTAFGNTLVTVALSGTTAGNAITGVIGGTGNQQLVAISKIGNSTWTLSNAGNNYTGGTTFSAGTLVFSNGALGTTGAITASGGTLRWASGNTQDISSRLAMTAVTSTFDTNGNNVTFANAIGSGVAAGLTKIGSGTLTLQGTNTYTGSTTVNAGTLALDYGTNDTTKLSNTTALILGGGTLNLSGGTHTEIVASTTLTAGTGSYVTRSSGSSILQMGTITNNTGTVNFGASNIATTNNTNTNGILGSWATVGDDWAINSTNLANGLITAYTGYTDLTRQSSGTKAIADDATSNVRIVEGSGGSPADITVTGTIAINTLNQSSSGGTNAANISMANQTLRTNGILMGSTAGNLTIGAAGGTAALSGTLTATTSGGSIIVTNNSTNTLTINSVIANNTTTSLVKNGTGVLVLTAANTYTGGTILQDGTIRVGATQNTGGANSILGSYWNIGLTIANKSTAVFDLNNFNTTIKDLGGGGSLGGNVTLGSGTLDIRNPGLQTYSGIISGTGNLTVGDTQNWTTTSAHTYTGITTVRGGIYIATILADGGIASGIGQSSSAADRLIILNGTLSYNGTTAASTNRQFTLTGNGGFGVESTGAITWSSTAAITHSGAGTRTLNFARNGTGLGTFASSIGDNGASAVSINKTGTSNWSLTHSGSAFTGGITLNTTNTSAGTLSYASAGGANAITFNQTTSTATLSYIGAADKTMNGAITASALTTGTITFDSSGAGAINYSNTASMGTAASGNKNLILSGANTGNNTLAAGWNNNTGGAATVTKNGAGKWILSGANTYTGNTVVNAGTLQINGSYAVAGAGTTSLLLVGNGAGNNGAMIIGSGAGTVTFSGNGYLNAAAVGISGGTGALTIDGGTVNLAGTTGTAAASLHIGVQVSGTGGTGTVTVNGGTLNVGQRILMGANNAVSNGTLTIAGGVVNVGYNGTLGYTGNNPGSVQFGQGTTTVNLNGGNLRLFGFKSTSTTNTINFNGGTITALGNQNFFIGNNGANDTATSAVGAITTKVQSGGAVVDTNNFNITMGSALEADAGSPGGGLTKSGAGILTLSGSNTYTGATNVNAGSLFVNGSIASSSLTNVASGATIGGSGTIGALTVSSSGFISGGDSVDNTSILTINGAYTQAGSYTSHIAGTGAGNFDQLNVSGAVNITGGSLTAMFTGGSYSNGDLIFILLNDNSDAITGTYTGFANGATVATHGGYNWNISYFADSGSSMFTGGNDIALQAVLIPEPKAALLGCLGLLLLLRRKRQ